MDGWMDGFVISDFLCGVRCIFALLGFYAAWIGSLLPTFRQNRSVPTLRPKHDERTAGILKTGLINCTETLVNNCRSTLRKIPGERLSGITWSTLKNSAFRPCGVWCVIGSGVSNSTWFSKCHQTICFSDAGVEFSCRVRSEPRNHTHMNVRLHF